MRIHTSSLPSSIESPTYSSGRSSHWPNERTSVRTLHTLDAGASREMAVLTTRGGGVIVIPLKWHTAGAANGFVKLAFNLRSNCVRRGGSFFRQANL